MTSSVLAQDLTEIFELLRIIVRMGLIVDQFFQNMFIQHYAFRKENESEFCGITLVSKLRYSIHLKSEKISR